MLENLFNLICAEATDGLKCLEFLDALYTNKMCRCQPIKIIFMDIEMPRLDGKETSKILKKKMKDQKLPEIPIIALTAFLDEKDNCLKSGMDEFSNFLF